MTEQAHDHSRTGLGVLALGALGVVFGDIGTSPLYTLRECLKPEFGARVDRADVLGVLSLIFWALTLVVTLKYLVFVMRADNRGEGGILALLALAPLSMNKRSRVGGWVAVLVIAGAALLYGDGIITPSISVLSAMEGMEVATPDLKDAVVPLTCVILIALFAVQSRGTGTVGKLFGPIMIVWFFVIGGLGAIHLAKNPSVLAALSPSYGAAFFASHGGAGFGILGSVVLAVTGGEALYADMGHFGARPIRLSWLTLVMPALVLSYFGQGALLLADPAKLDNPFFAMVPNGPLTIALVVLSGLATIIASQALISGAFSLTHQAVQLGFFPRVTVKHTSRETEGQIYVPEINWGLAVACVVLVLAFRESGKLAAAYGIAVSGTMAITSVIYYVVTRQTWRWPIYKSLPLLLLFLSFDLPFFAANLTKFRDGGYVPVLVGAGFLTVMLNWRVGRSVLAEYIAKKAPPLEAFIGSLDSRLAARTPGVSVFMATQSTNAPPVLVHFVERARVLTERVILLTVATEHVPVVHDKDRFEVNELERGFMRVVIKCGFMEQPHVPARIKKALASARFDLDMDKATYFVGHETFLATKAGKMGTWSETLFAFLSRNAKPATSYFALPPDQVMEVGAQIDL